MQLQCDISVPWYIITSQAASGRCNVTVFALCRSDATARSTNCKEQPSSGSDTESYVIGGYSDVEPDDVTDDVLVTGSTYVFPDITVVAHISHCVKCCELEGKNLPQYNS